MSQPATENKKPILKRNHSALMIVIMGIALAVLLLAIWRFTNHKTDQSGLVSGNGRIEATDVDVAAKLPGRVTAIFVDEGDFVHEGQLVANMQTDELNAQRDEAAAQLAQARAAVAGAEAQVSVRKGDVAAAKAVVVQRQSELKAVRSNYERFKKLAEEAVISEQEFDDIDAKYQAMSAAVVTAQSQVTAAEAARQAAEAQVLNARSGVLAVEATIARITSNIEDSALKAPKGGRVQYRVAQPGEVVGSGGKIVSIVDLSDVYMTFFLPEEAAGKVSMGQEVRIVLDAAPDCIIPAEISYVASVAQFTPKTVETASERQKLMFRVKAKISPELLRQNIEAVKTGLPGVAWVMLNPEKDWPKNLEIKVKK